MRPPNFVFQSRASWTVPICAFGFLFVLTAATPQALIADAPVPLGRACTTLMDETNSEKLLISGAKPSAGKQVIVHADASQACDLIVAPFIKKDGSLPSAWRPMLAHLEAGGEVRLPPADDPWAVTSELEPFEIFIAFLPKSSSQSAPICDLVGKLRDPNMSATAIKLLAHSLREKLQAWAADDRSAKEKPASVPTEIAGTIVPVPGPPQTASRTVEAFNWKRAARALPLSEKKPSVTVFRSGRR